MSLRFSRRMSDVITQDVETSCGVGKSDADKSFGEEGSCKENS